MRRRVLAIPREEIESHFRKNARQDVKIIAPSILTDESFRKLAERGKSVKAEETLEGFYWKHSEAHEANRVCEAGDFMDELLPQHAKGPFSISFANENAEQEAHYHQQHFEIYYSEYPLSAEFRYLDDAQRQQPIELKSGGVILFGPDVIHRVRLGGLTIVIEVAALDDKLTGEL